MSRTCISVASVVLLCLVTAGLAAVPDPDVGWWRFDEGSGDTVMDSSGNGRDGMIQSATWVDGGWNGLGWCLDFDGNDDRVELGVVDVEGPGITLAGWLQPDDFEIDDARIISKANEWGGNDHWWMMGQINASFLRFRLKTTDGQGTTTLIASEGELQIGEWQHAAATWDGTTMRIFRNAVEVASVAKGGDAVATSATVRAAIGSQPEGAYATDPLHANKFFDGRIDEVRIYSYALTPAELSELIKGLHPIAWSPDPADGAVGVVQPLLQWKPSEDGLFHNVYLGTSPDLGEDDLVAPRQALAMYWHLPGLEPGVTYYWRIDDVALDGTVVTGRVWHFTTATVLASQPQPADGAKWIDHRNVILSWLLGQNAAMHEVYFGTGADDVAAGTGDTFQGRQPQTQFDPGLLEEDTTYYWRVDEIDATGATVPGDLWSFTTAGAGGGLKGEYFGNPDLVGEPVMVRTDPSINFQWDTAGPGQPVGTSGYSVRWTGELEAAFTEVYTLMTHADDGVKLWFNGELVVDKWFGQERGAPSYAVNVSMEAGQRYPIVMEYFFSDGSAVAELWWSSAHTPEQVIPTGAFSLLLSAHSPNPAHHAVHVPHTPRLTWRAGERAAQHDVYFSDDEQAVANATAADAGIYRGRQALDELAYDPGVLEWNKTYYWRIDEVNAADADSPWTGSVWSFTTADFIVVDDFERYTDDIDAGQTIYQTWIDGFENGTGSIVGYMEAREGTFGERQIVHGGKQSMPLEYDNISAPHYAEAERTWATPQDWTANGVDALTLHIKGKGDNGPDPLYATIEDGAGRSATAVYPDSALATLTTWTRWDVPLSDFAGVDVTAVKKMIIGLGNRHTPTPGGAGLIFIDNVWVSRSESAQE